jgi:hypothetical protein
MKIVTSDNESIEDIHENKGIEIDNDELIKDMPDDYYDILDDDYNIEKNIVDYSSTEGWFVLNGNLSFFWKPSRIDIIDKSFDGGVTMERCHLIEFLKKSDFLPQHGYKIVKMEQVT